MKKFLVPIAVFVAIGLLLVRMRSILAERERNTSWVAALFGGKS